MKRLNNIGSFFYWLVMLLILLLGLVVAASAFDVPGGLKLFTVQSGSMEPSIPTGSLVFVRPQTAYQVGDIITFKSDKDRSVSKPAVTTTHRVFEIEQLDQRTVFTTKGDANNAPDANLVSDDLILGKTTFHIPLIGYLVSFARTIQGLILLIVIPATIIIYSELMNIKNEAGKLIAAKKKRKLTLMENVEEKIAEEMKGLKK